MRKLLLDLALARRLPAYGGEPEMGGAERHPDARSALAEPRHHQRDPAARLRRAHALRQAVPGRALPRDGLEADRPTRSGASTCARASSSTTARRSPPTTWCSPSAASSRRRARCRSTSPACKEVIKVDDHTVDFILVRPGADPAAQHRRLPHHEQGLGGEEPLAERAGLREEGRDLRLAQHQRHRPLHDQGLGAGQADRVRPQQGLVGQARRQRRPKWSTTPIKSDATRVVGAPRRATSTSSPTCRCRTSSACARKPKLKVLDGHEVRTIFIGMDQHNNELKYSSVKGKNPFKDVRVRQALNMAVDREAIKRVDDARPVDPRRHHGRARRARLREGHRHA